MQKENSNLATRKVSIFILLLRLLYYTFYKTATQLRPAEKSVLFCINFQCPVSAELLNKTKENIRKKKRKMPPLSQRINEMHNGT